MEISLIYLFIYIYCNLYLPIGEGVYYQMKYNGKPGLEVRDQSIVGVNEKTIMGNCLFVSSALTTRPN